MQFLILILLCSRAKHIRENCSKKDVNHHGIPHMIKGEVVSGFFLNRIVSLYLAEAIWYIKWVLIILQLHVDILNVVFMLLIFISFYRFNKLHDICRVFNISPPIIKAIKSQIEGNKEPKKLKELALILNNSICQNWHYVIINYFKCIYLKEYEYDRAD